MKIYYAETSGRYLERPKSVLGRFSEKFNANGELERMRLLKCPAIVERLRNTYAICSIHDYELSFVNGGIGSTMYGEEYFRKEFVIRSTSLGALSYRPPSLIFFAEKPCILTQLPPYYEDTDLFKHTYLVTGSYDIGRHIRGLEATFIFKGPAKVQIKEGEPLYYLHFDTKEKIEFQPFIYTEQIKNLTDRVLSDRGFTKKVKPLQWWYDKFVYSGYRKKVLELIEKNLLDDKV